MARPKRLRHLASAPPVHCFHPADDEHCYMQRDIIILSMDEFESLRLADLECHSQELAAKKMGISRATFGRIIEAGRSKVARALVEGCRLEISGGSFMFGHGRHLQCPRCRRRQQRSTNTSGHIECGRCCQPLLHNDTIKSH